MKRFAGFAILLAFVLAFAALPSKAGEFPHWSRATALLDGWSFTMPFPSMTGL